MKETHARTLEQGFLTNRSLERVMTSRVVGLDLLGLSYSVLIVMSVDGGGYARKAWQRIWLRSYSTSPPALISFLPIGR